MTSERHSQSIETDKPINLRGISMVAIGALGFSTTILFTRLTQGLNVMSIVFYRALFAFGFFCILLGWFPQTLRFSQYRGTIKSLLALGISVGVTACLYIYAVQHTTVANAVLLNNTAPLYVALLAPKLLKESRPRYTWPSLALAFVGIVCIANPTQKGLNASALTGILAGFLSGISLASVMLFSSSMRTQVNGVTQTWWGVGIAALIAMPWALQTPWSIVAVNLRLLIPLGIVSYGLPYLLYFLGLQQTGAQVASIVALLEPVGGIMIGALCFAEIPNLLGMMGISLVLSGIYLISQ